MCLDSSFLFSPPSANQSAETYHECCRRAIALGRPRPSRTGGHRSRSSLLPEPPCFRDQRFQFAHNGVSIDRRAFAVRMSQRCIPAKHAAHFARPSLAGCLAGRPLVVLVATRDALKPHKCVSGALNEYSGAKGISTNRTRCREPFAASSAVTLSTASPSAAFEAWYQVRETAISLSRKLFRFSVAGFGPG